MQVEFLARESDSIAVELIDNTAPAERPADDAPFYKTTTTTSTGSRLWSRPSIRAGRARRKYAKWQPDRLGVAEDSATDGEQLSSDEREFGRVNTNGNTLTNASTVQESSNNLGCQSNPQPFEQTAEQVQQQDFGAVPSIGTTQSTTHQSQDHPKICGLKPGSGLDILYENQRGWFFFGIPLYSDRSLLNLDPTPWMNGDGKRSIVNITNAQVPDPSWEWAWRTWYVDMSGDVDEQGWQYAFSFASSSWHGTHPFFHSFVRRRRWVRLRVKRASERHRRSRTDLEMAHMLNADYFTIHSAVTQKRASSSERASRATSVNLAGNSTGIAEEVFLEEIRNIPSLMHALKAAVVDREKLDAVKTFLEEGGDELYYLDETIPEIMARFVYQASRWQLLTRLKDTAQALSSKQNLAVTGNDKQKAENLERKQKYISKAVETAQRHLLFPEVLQETSESPKLLLVPGLVDLTLGNRKDSLLSRISGRYTFEPMDNGGKIKGIPRQAEIGHDHIQRCGLSAGFGDHFAVCHASVAADEPLLFLYPRWFAYVPQQSRRSLNTTVSRQKKPDCSPGEPPSHPGTHYSQHHQQPFAAPPQKWLSTNSKAMLPKTETATKNTATATISHSNTTTVLVGKNGEFDAFVGLDTGPEESSDPLFERPRAVIRRDLLQRYRRGAFEGSTSSDCPSLSHLPRHEAKRMRKRDFWMSRFAPEEHVSLYQQLKKMMLTAERRARFRTSRVTSPDAKHELHRRQILVPEETIALLCGPSWASTGSESINENIWYVRLHNGCRVHVFPAVESVGQNRKVILTGSEWVTSLVESRIKQTQELQEIGDALIDIQKPPVPIFPSLRALDRDGLSAPLVRGVWNTSSVSQPSTTTLDLVTNDSKNISTVRAFVEQVDELTSSLSTPNNRRHIKKVATSLHQLFLGTKTRHLASTAALNKAISFLLRHGYPPYAQSLILRGEHVITIDTLNIFLKAAAKDQNIPLFFQVMRILIRLQIPPNPDTLVAYLSCLNRPASRTKMVKLMEEKGYLQDPTVMRQVMQLTVFDVFTEHLKEGKSVDAFINKIIRALGRPYLAAPLINRMFHITLSLKNLLAMQQLLRLCKINGVPLNSATLFHLIRFFKHDTFFALDYALDCLENPKSKLDKKTYEALFSNAFANRHYNICRVLWWYACIDGMVTKGMELKLAELLAQNTPKEGHTQQENLWRNSAGTVILGIGLRSHHFPLKQSLLKDIPAEFHDNPVASLMSGSVLQGEEHAAQRRAARAIIKHDMEFGSWYRPKLPLANMLEAAAELDRQWKDVPRTRNWPMQNAIQVPVELVGHGFSQE
ncbi:hypothetical protein BJY01DRAFT_231930 [Aspergillus pseudoustus]|uniref:Peroxin/Ferlin domain-containing protein n=1 Tax=Aspergillus pseudoustus TaxID=1810923 RepID=A0ABR4KPZ2_9EURO